MQSQFPVSSIDYRRSSEFQRSDRATARRTDKGDNDEMERRRRSALLGLCCLCALVVVSLGGATAAIIVTRASDSPAPATTIAPTVAPTPDPYPFNYVFVSSATYPGDMGGLAGADAKCQALADAAGATNATYGFLSGRSWKAWLSSELEETGPRFRFNGSSLPYYLVDNATMIAPNFTTFIEPTIALLAPINLTEIGTVPPMGDSVCSGVGLATVRTHTTGTGRPYPGPSALEPACDDWTSNVTDFGASAIRYGTIEEHPVVTAWTSRCSIGEDCGRFAPIYCFEDGP